MTARFGNDVGEGDRFFEHAALGIVGAAFADLDDVDVGQPDAAAGVGRALAVALGELALGTLLQAADGGDHDPHRAPPLALSSPAVSRLRPARPHLFEIVEGAHFRPEDVDDDVAGVDQHPVAMRHALDAHAADAGLVQILEHAIRDRADMTVRPPGGHNHESAIEVLPREIDGDGVLGLHVVEAGEDEAKGLLGVRTHLGDRSGGATRAGPGDCRCGQGALSFRFLHFTASPCPANRATH